MPIGPGKYDDACTQVREQLQADGVMLVVFGGNKGSGFSVQGGLALIVTLPDMLEDMARQMRHSMDLHAPPDDCEAPHG
jgi:methylmalonyl-CoA mutase cobalamin-binding subunit